METSTLLCFKLLATPKWTHNSIIWLKLFKTKIRRLKIFKLPTWKRITISSTWLLWSRTSISSVYHWKRCRLKSLTWQTFCKFSTTKFKLVKNWMLNINKKSNICLLLLITNPKKWMMERNIWKNSNPKSHTWWNFYRKRMESWVKAMLRFKDMKTSSPILFPFLIPQIKRLI